MNATWLMFAVGQVPQLAVYVVALAVALGRWNRHPQASMLVTVGATLELGASLGSTVVTVMLTEQPGSRVAVFYSALHLAGVVGLALIVAAVFSERGPKQDSSQG